MSQVATPESTVAVRAVNATKTYGKGEASVVALNDVSVEFAIGRFTAIMGPSGSGKSTLMHAMAGLDDLNSGNVFIGDVNLSGFKKDVRQRGFLGRLIRKPFHWRDDSKADKALTLLRRDKVGFIFQQFNLVPTLTALENITLPRSLAGEKPDQAWLDSVIDIVGLRDRLKHRPSELSGGQQQRVAVARALASKPEIIFADEPTGNLDSKAGTEILLFMQRAVKEFNQTIVMVTHDAVAASYADRVVFLADGKIVDELESPTTDSVLDRIKKLGG